MKFSGIVAQILLSFVRIKEINNAIRVYFSILMTNETRRVLYASRSQLTHFKIRRKFESTRACTTKISIFPRYSAALQNLYSKRGIKAGAQSTIRARGIRTRRDMVSNIFSLTALCGRGFRDL